VPPKELHTRDIYISDFMFDATKVRATADEGRSGQQIRNTEEGST
jgi:hypothetical protein